MPNPQNLVKGKATQFKSGDKAAKECGRKGGVKSGEAKRKKADLREALQDALCGKYKKAGKTLTGEEMLITSIMAIACDPGYKSAAVQAFKTIAEMLGQDRPEQTGEDDDMIKVFLDNLRGGDRE